MRQIILIGPGGCAGPATVATMNVTSSSKKVWLRQPLLHAIRVEELARAVLCVGDTVRVHEDYVALAYLE